MKVSGKRSFTLSQVDRLELLVIRAALNDYYQMEMNESVEQGITPQGEVALRLLNQINEYQGG
jgi:hypothetical protein